jgi:hypothetical protein
MQHYYKTIQGWFSFEGIYREMVQNAPKDKPSIFIEVGSWKGRSSAFMGIEIKNSHKPIEFYAVDHWKGSDEEAHRKDPDVIRGSLFDAFMRNIKPVKDYVHPIPLASIAATAHFLDGTVDFLFLDGGHDYESVRDDLAYWLPKMKDKGVVAGDDYNWSGVKQAISEILQDQVEVLGDGKGRHWRFTGDIQKARYRYYSRPE